ncbi:MAG: mechanosensitive ion channel family protein [Terriglobia bacterium]
MGSFIVRSLNQMLTNFSGMVMEFLPRLLAMAIIIVAGFVIAWIVRVILRRILLFFRFNSLFESAGLGQMMPKTTLPSPTDLLVRLVFWVVWVAFMLFGVSALGVVALQEGISRLFLLIPQIFVALVILFVGLLIANFAARAALLAAVNANSSSPRLLSGAVRFVIVILAVTMALERIGLGHGVVLVAFAIFFGATMLGLALAFGLGGRDMARRLLERRFADERKEEDEGISHL